MYDKRIFGIGLVIVWVLAIVLFWTEIYSPSLAVLTPTSTPWGTPPWWPAGVTSTYVCSTKDPGCENPKALWVPSDSLQNEVYAAGNAWGISIRQMIHCLNPVCSEALVVDRYGRYFLARWYPLGSPDWPQGGWTFTQIPVRTREVQWQPSQ